MTLVSKNVYIDKLDDIVNKYNNTYHSTIKMKPVDVNETQIYSLVKKQIKKILDLKLVILSLKKSKILCRGLILSMILMEKKLWEHFMKKNWKKQIKKKFRTEKVIKRKGDKLYVN